MNDRSQPDVRRRALVAGALLACAGLPARAQAWPGKPIRLIVAGPAGGSADLVARMVAEPLSRELGQPLVVENKLGAGGSIAVADLLQSPRDGYTFLVGVNSLVSEVPHILKLRWDTMRELRPVAELARGGLVLVGNPALPARNLQELIAYAKAHAGQLNYASYSPGTMSHVLGLLLNRAAGIDLVHVGYKGSTPALTDVMGGHVSLMFDGLATSLPLIAAGKLRAYAVSTPQRVPQLPQVPTFHELGFPTLDALAWMGLWTTPDAPAAVQTQLRNAVLKVLGEPSLRHRMLETGFDVGTPRPVPEMQAGLKADYERMGGVLHSIGFTPE